MKGWLAVALLIVATAFALLAPWAPLAIVALGAWLAMRKRAGFTAFAAMTLAISALLMAWLDDSPKQWQWGVFAFGVDGVRMGLVGGLRITTLLGINMALLQSYPPAQWLDDLRMPRRAQGFTAAVLIAAQDIGRDFERLRDARRLDGDWPDGRVKQAGTAASMLPALMVAAYDRSRRRRDALRLAGMDTGPWFAPIVAVTALAIAGRLALVALPNIALTFVIVFAGGVAFGARVGAWAGFWSMLLTDVMLSGLYVPAFVNVPTMALLGASGGLFRYWPGGWPDRAMAGALGVVMTLAWSVATDALSWALIAEYRGNTALLGVQVLAGLVFNAAPALANGFLFSAAVGPIGRAFSALQATPAAPRTSPTQTADHP